MNNYSVLMSVYKNENPRHFELSLKSIFSQTMLTDDFVLIIDGEIGEDLNRVVEKYQEAHPDTLRVIRFSENKGLGYALRFGIEECRNDLVARMDSDDVSVSTRCEEQLNYFIDHPETSVLGTQIIDFFSPTEMYGHKLPVEDPDIRKFMRTRCPFGHPSVMLNKQAVLKAGNYSEGMRNQQDYNLWIRMCAADGFVFHNLDRPLLLMRNSDSLITRRGGIRYFRKGMANQKLMLSLGVIGRLKFVINTIERFAVQVLMPAFFRKWVYKKVLRKATLNDETLLAEVRKCF